MVKIRYSFVLAILFLASVYFPSVFADRGMIPISPDVSVYEPGQKAILAWNGHEEIMVLSTDVTSSQETLVVEILPLPSKPDVEAASFQSFEEIQRLIWQEGMNMLMYNTEGGARSGSVEVIFHEEIGAHNITVVRADGTSELSSWMSSFLESSGVGDAVSLGNFGSVVEDYMDRGYRYYVLDLITFSSEERSIDPILYKFDSDFLYYPLVITSPVGGDTEITLFILTEEKIYGDYSWLQKASYITLGGTSKPIEFVLSKGDLSKIDLRIGDLFSYKAWLAVLTYKGKVSYLDRDLMISSSLPITEQTINVDIAIPSTIIVLCVALGAASSLAGVATTLLVIKSKHKEKT